ncbi:MAG: hypothetical protein SAJ12_07280 [Jaaginema sp. PMC 1079.18]|nr:hypothetical protein [Jaaginema sp. PMC 1080.18]MEC4850799.1 hypothetical protein [Jaaginema sp. PMC 1079.18]MEC4868170.1 hypothetical protein [Jaaginema sp. PMC 1078.18]
MSQLALADSSLWGLLWNTDITAVTDSLGRYEPISPITVPVVPDSHILAAYISSSTAKSYWRFAGFCTQKLQTGITVGGSINTDASPERRKVWLNRWTLLDFPKYTQAYSMVFEPPHWLQQYSIQLFQWTGEDERHLTFLRDGTELGEKIDELRGDMSAIQADLDYYFLL